jgi:hypothetical protein
MFSENIYMDSRPIENPDLHYRVNDLPLGWANDLIIFLKNCIFCLVYTRATAFLDKMRKLPFGWDNALESSFL